MLVCGPAAIAETLRIATYNTDLSRKGPALLLRDILSGKDDQVDAVVQVLLQLDADVLALTSFDFDRNLVALSAFADLLGQRGSPYPYRFALRPNTGMATGLDLDRNGRSGDPRDAQGFGYFSGQDGMAILSRLPVKATAAQDYSGFLWQDLPEAMLPDDMPPAVRSIQRLSTTGHWQVPIALNDGRALNLLFWHATPPVFDGPEDRNGRRNHDEAAFWLHLLDGNLAFPPPAWPFVLLGDGNLDPEKGDGRTAAMNALLKHPALQDPLPSQATADYAQPGPLRVDFLLPSAGLQVVTSGVLRPGGTGLDAAVFTAASRHFPVWADLTLTVPNQ